MTDTLPKDEPDGFWTRTTSPDGRHVWIVNADEVKMSHWIMGGALWRREPREKIFVAPYPWSFEGRTWVSNGELALTGRCYPGRLPGIKLTLELERREGTILVESPAAWVKPGEVPVAPAGPRPLEEIVRWLDAFPRD